jgi:hypothetical protein
MGRMGPRRHGRVDLRARPRAGAGRPPPEIRYRRLARDGRLLRKHPAGAVPAWLGPLDDLGPHQRSHRPRARADAHDPVLLGVHVHVRTGEQHLAARHPPRLGGARDRRGAAGRHGLSRRGAVREPAEDRRGIDAHRLLLRLLLRVGRQLLHRRQLRMAMDVCHRRPAGSDGPLHSVQRERVDEMEGEVRRRQSACAPSSFRRPTCGGRW